jgi:hypothetical protein
MLMLSVIIPDHLCMRFCDLNYKPMTIVNDDYRVINKLEASLTDDARVVIYDCHMFIVKATGLIYTCSINLHYLYLLGVQARESALKSRCTVDLRPPLQLSKLKPKASNY